MKKRALVLSGGGSKGAYEVGAMKALAEKGAYWTSVHGVSAGALNASWVAMRPPEEQAKNIDELVDIWKGVKSSDNIYKGWAPGFLKYLWSMWKGSLHSGAPLRKLVKSYWDREKSIKSGVKLTVGCVSLTTGLYHAFDQSNDNIMEYILASSHLPVVFEPLTVDGEQWVDGGIRHQIPILDALKERPDEIDVIITSPVSVERLLVATTPYTSAPGAALRAAEVMSDQGYMDDYFTIIQAAKDFEGKIKFNVYIPSVQPNADSMNFDGKILEEGIDMGYRETKASLEATDDKENKA